MWGIDLWINRMLMIYTLKTFLHGYRVPISPLRPLNGYVATHRPHFFICWITLLLGKFQSVVIGKNKNKNWTWTKVVHIFTSVISIEHMSIRLEVNFSPKHQLICNFYHSNKILSIFHVGNKLDKHFTSFH